MATATNSNHPDNNPRLLQALLAFCIIGAICIIGDVLGFIPKDVQGFILVIAAVAVFLLK